MGAPGQDGCWPAPGRAPYGCCWPAPTAGARMSYGCPKARALASARTLAGQREEVLWQCVGAENALKPRPCRRVGDDACVRVLSTCPYVSGDDVRPPHPRSQCCLQEGPRALQHERPFLRRTEKASSPLNIEIGGKGGIHFQKDLVVWRPCK